MTLAQSLLAWKIKYNQAPEAFIKILSERFSAWRYLTEYSSAIPTETHPLIRAKYGDDAIAHVWNIVPVKFHLNANDSTRFLLVGDLRDGAKLAIDTHAKRSMSMGVFSVSDCGLKNWSDLKSVYFQRFPFSYPEYLDYLLNVKDDCPEFMSGG